MTPFESFAQPPVAAEPAEPIEAEEIEPEDEAEDKFEILSDLIEGVREEAADFDPRLIGEAAKAEVMRSRHLNEATECLRLFDDDGEINDLWTSLDAAFADKNAAEKRYARLFKCEVFSRIAGQELNAESKFEILNALIKGLREEAAEFDPKLTEEDAKTQVIRSRFLSPAEEYLRFFQNVEDEIEELWAYFDDAFAEAGESERRFAQLFKDEVRSQVAGQGLIKEIEQELAKRNVRVEIRIAPAAAKEDIDHQIDFWVAVELKNREKMIPCRVYYIDVHTERPQTNQRFGDFIKRNYINFHHPNKTSIKDATAALREKVTIFYDLNPSGVLVLLPKYDEQTILPNGKVNQAIRKNFIEKAMKDPGLWDEFIP